MNATEKQRHSDAAYVQAYRVWISSLPPEERAALAARDLDEPDAKRSTGKVDDQGVLAVAAVPRSEPEATDVQTQIRMATADALSSFCARVRSHTNPLLAFDTLCFATGLMEVEGLSQSALARRHGVTKAWFSQQVIGWLDLFGLPPPRGCRNLRARASCRRARIAVLDRIDEGSTTPATAAVQSSRKRRRYPLKSEDPTVVYVRGLDLFRQWFRQRTRRYPVEQWTPDARRLLRKELTWFMNLYARLGD